MRRVAVGCGQRLVGTLDDEEKAMLDRLLRKLSGPGLAARREGG